MGKNKKNQFFGQTLGEITNKQAQNCCIAA